MPLTPPKRDIARCCSRCTGKPHLSSCRKPQCPCHMGHASTMRLEPAPQPIHRCETESCIECLTCRYCGKPMTGTPAEETRANTIIAHRACKGAIR